MLPHKMKTYLITNTINITLFLWRQWCRFGEWIATYFVR